MFRVVRISEAENGQRTGPIRLPVGYAEAGAYAGLAFIRRPGKPDAWAHVAFVQIQSGTPIVFGRDHKLIGSGVPIRLAIVAFDRARGQFVAKTEVESQRRQNFEIVLCIKRVLPDTSGMASPRRIAPARCWS